MSGEIGENAFVSEVAESPELLPKTNEVLGVLEVNRNFSLAYREIRFKSTPGMQEANDAGDTESIAEHMWAVQQMWRNLQGACPALSDSVDADRVTELLGMHDIGEIVKGDVSRHILLDGEHKERHLGEREGLLQIVAPLSAETQDYYLDLFDEYENPDWTTWSKEAATGHLIDSLQGDAHYFDYGDITQHPDKTRQLMHEYTGRPAKRLIDIFAMEENMQAIDDVMDILEAHCTYITGQGFSISVDELLAPEPEA